MNGVSGLQTGLPATTVIRLSAGRPIPVPALRHPAAAATTLLAAVCHPRRMAQVTPLSALLPQVLASYGLDLPPASKHSATCQFEHCDTLA